MESSHIHAIDPICWLEQLPDDIILNIFGYLEPKDLSIASRVCSIWKTLAEKIKWPDGVGNRLLARALKYKDQDVALHVVLKLLRLKDKIGINPSLDDNRVIFWASENGHHEIVRELLKEPLVDLSVLQKVMRFAMQCNHPKVVKELLINNQINPSFDNNTLISWASENGHLEIVEDLVKDDRVNPSANNNLPIRKASRRGHVEIVKVLLKNEQVDPSAEENEALRYSSENGFHEVVKELLKHERVDPSAKGYEAIFHAFKFNRFEVIGELLKSKRVDLSWENNYCFRTAVEKGLVEIVKELLKNELVDPAVNENEPIRLASQKGYVEIVKELLQHPHVDPAAKNNQALYLACMNGHLEVVKELIKHVDPSVDENYIIRCTSQKGHHEIVKELLQHPLVDPAAKNNQAFYFACQYGHLEVVKIFLKDKRVDPFANENKAFLEAYQNGHNEVVQELLMHKQSAPLNLNIDNRKKILLNKTYSILLKLFNDTSDSKRRHTIFSKIVRCASDELRKFVDLIDEPYYYCMSLIDLFKEQQNVELIDIILKKTSTFSSEFEQNICYGYLALYVAKLDIKKALEINSLLPDFYQNDVYREIAKIQAASGDIEQALETASKINYKAKYCITIFEIAEALKNEDLMHKAFESALEIKDNRDRVDHLFYLGEKQTQLIFIEKALRLLTNEFIHSSDTERARDELYSNCAQLQANFNFDQALREISNISRLGLKLSTIIEISKFKFVPELITKTFEEISELGDRYFYIENLIKIYTFHPTKERLDNLIQKISSEGMYQNQRDEYLKRIVIFEASHNFESAKAIADRIQDDYMRSCAFIEIAKKL